MSQAARPLGRTAFALLRAIGSRRGRRALVLGARRLAVEAFRISLLVGISFVILYPLLIKLSSSLMLEEDVMDPTVFWLPKTATLHNYRLVVRIMDYWTNALNSLKLALLVSATQVASCTLAGYGLARFRFGLNRVLFGVAIFSLVVPPQLVTIPLYFNFRYFDPLGLLPGKGVNLLSGVLPFLLTSGTCTGFRNGLYVYIMRQVFKSMPVDLEDAASVDGAGYLRTFLQIMLPGATSAILVTFVFSFVWQWNDVFYTRFFMPNARVLPVALEWFPQYFADWYIAEHAGLIAMPRYRSAVSDAAMLLFVAPVLVVYLCLQRYFKESIDRTGLVG